MNELSKTYDPLSVEPAIYSKWLSTGAFRSVPDQREAFTIVMPPPNVTGVLHMGHMLNNTIQDVLIRRARMLGKNACWVPGTDHASIATEAKVVRMLRDRGILKSSLSRDEFLKYAWEWKEKYGGIILDQLKKLGSSCDWDRTHFTMDPEYYRAVIKVFVDLYKKGYIYRGLRMINWDCEARTALSNEEVLYKEGGEVSRMYSVRYRVADSPEYITIATQRPETIMGDVAVAVNPNDERYKHLLGKKVIVPFVNREVQVIADSYVDPEFGTGCLKVTPAHDINDYEIGIRHNLEVIDTLNDDGTMSAACGVPELVGVERFEARKKVVRMLDEMGILAETKEFTTRIGRSERTNTVVEPRLSLQWFIRMKEISGKALEAVESDEIRLHPAKFKNTYRHWMENVRDWCISRQLWWGHRIPAWYSPDGSVAVAETEDEAFAQLSASQPNLRREDIRQDEDVLDTWASSWLWPVEVFKGFAAHTPGSDQHITAVAELNYYYPTAVLVTAPEILFFWVARMVIAGYEYTGKPPFSDVYLTGIVRDKQGRKMSKSLGNSPDPLELIEKYGADGVRVGMLLCSPAGNDLPFDESLCEQGRNFSNKIWNSFRLIHGWNPDASMSVDTASEQAVQWFGMQMSETIREVNHLFSQFRLSEALMAVYKLIWDDFCSTYLEIIKPRGGNISTQVYNETVRYFEDLLKLIHPFMPFITEELWSHLKQRNADDMILNAPWPVSSATDEQFLISFRFALDTVTAVRNFRNEKGIPMKESLVLMTPESFATAPVVQKLAGVESVETVAARPDGTYTVMVGAREFYIPAGNLVDSEAEKKKLLSELEYTIGFKKSVENKLGNERFVQNAKPEVVEAERRKLTDAEQKIRLIEEQLKMLS
jgi:valyl-tRNA synthetase